MMKTNVIDLFAGVGGMSKGFEDEGFNIILANEIDKSIAHSYKKNHPDTIVVTDDITKLNIEKTFENYKDTVVIVGGPPCQGFSQKGKRAVIDDSRNYLFKYFYMVVKFIKPKYFVIENVPNILTANNGSFKNDIYRLFQKEGYTLNSAILNAVDYGVPQNRRRAFILGKLGTEKLAMPGKTDEFISVWDAISDLNYLESGEGSYKSKYILKAKTDYQKMMREKTKILYNHKATSHSDIAIERMMLVPKNGSRNDLPKEHLTKSIYSGTWSRLNKKEASVTITTRFDTPSSGKFTHPLLHRTITVREAARIQSFPDSFIFYGTKGSQMKQVGNAVPPKLAKAIASQIRKDMEKENE